MSTNLKGITYHFCEVLRGMVGFNSLQLSSWRLVRSSGCSLQIHFLDKSTTLELKLIRLGVKCKRSLKSCRCPLRISKAMPMRCIVITAHPPKKRPNLCTTMMKYARSSCVRKYSWSTSTTC